MLRRWLETPSISWEYDWMPMDCLLGGGCTQNISSEKKKKNTENPSTHTQRFRWQANLSSVGQVTLYLTNRLDEERILVWFLPKKVNSKWQTQQKRIWSAAGFLSWPFYCVLGWPSPKIGKPAPGNRKYEITPDPQRIPSPSSVALSQCLLDQRKNVFFCSAPPK